MGGLSQIKGERIIMKKETCILCGKELPEEGCKAILPLSTITLTDLLEAIEEHKAGVICPECAKTYNNT